MNRTMDQTANWNSNTHFPSSAWKPTESEFQPGWQSRAYRAGTRPTPTMCNQILRYLHSYSLTNLLIFYITSQNTTLSRLFDQIRGN